MGRVTDSDSMHKDRSVLTIENQQAGVGMRAIRETRVRRRTLKLVLLHAPRYGLQKVIVGLDVVHFPALVRSLNACVLCMIKFELAG